MQTSPFDPLTLEILWQRLITIADEMTAILLRTSFSTVIGAANDFACEIMDAEGHSVAPATRGMPLFNQTIPYVAQAVIEKYGKEGICPDDVFLANDPWLNTGHQPDIAVITPFFLEGRLMGFTGSTAHHADIGGALDVNKVREVYEEGLIIPLLRLYDEGRLNQLILDFVEANVRVPDMVLGDINAQVAANQAGGKRVVRLMQEYGMQDLQPLATEIQARAERAMRRAIQSVPNGEYRSRIQVDELDKPLDIACCIRIEDDELVVDFEGTSPQQPRGGINVTLSYARGDATYGLKSILLPDVPSNAGCYRPMEVKAPSGCLLNAERPVSLRQRHRIGFYVHRALYAALSAVLPEQVPAAPGFQVGTPTFCRSADGQRLYHAYNFFGGGMGAGPDTDGISTCMHPSSASNVPVELFEVAVPILVEQKEFLIDSGGAGRHRGGLGQKVEFRLLPGFDGEATVSIWAVGQNVPAFGLHGGAPGTAAQITMNGRVLTREEKLAQAGALNLTSSELTVGFESAGAGGNGPPEERAVAEVCRDVRDDLVSLEKAAELYGVVFDSSSLSVDKRATIARRQELRSNHSTEEAEGGE